MCAKIWRLVFVFTLILTAGCSALPGNGDSEPPEIIRIQLSSATDHWIPRIEQCAGDLTNAGVVVEVRPTPELDLTKSDVLIRFGFKNPSEEHVSVLADERIVFITTPGNPLNSISMDSLGKMLSGEYTNWMDLPESRDASGIYDLPIVVVSYGNGSDLRLVLTEVFDNQDTKTHYAASTESMIEVVRSTEGAVGYLLESQLPADMIPLGISDTDLLEGVFERPVLAISGQEPAGAARQLLLCLQNAD